jgi:pimeloyl-ACP methyl ester carboxylesterase
MPHVHVNDVRLFYEEDGAGEPLVLVHGGFSDQGNFRAVVPGLAASFRVVAYDRRGHSLSDRPHPFGSRRDQEDDLAALIETLGLSPAHVIGTSFGSAIALGLSVRRPDLVRTLTAHEPALPGLSAQAPAVHARLRAALARVERGDVEGGTQQFLEDVALGPGAWARFPEPIRATMVRNAPAVLEEQRDPAWDDVDRHALSNLEIPVLLTQGAQSPSWFAEVVAELRGLIGHARLHRYPDAGHSPHITHPREYVAAVTAFAAAWREVPSHA